MVWETPQTVLEEFRCFGIFRLFRSKCWFQSKMVLEQIIAIVDSDDGLEAVLGNRIPWSGVHWIGAMTTKARRRWPPQHGLDQSISLPYAFASRNPWIRCFSKRCNDNEGLTRPTTAPWHRFPLSIEYVIVSSKLRQYT